jgi:hypothetical protein
MQSVAPQVFDLFDAISLIASIFSLALAVIAIWLSIAFKRDADAVNAATISLLTEIRSDAKSVAQIVSGELREYGSAMRGAFLRNKMNSPSESSANTAGSQVEGNTQQGPAA